jgi:hypothetical protein
MFSHDVDSSSSSSDSSSSDSSFRKAAADVVVSSSDDVPLNAIVSDLRHLRSDAVSGARLQREQSRTIDILLAEVRSLRDARDGLARQRDEAVDRLRKSEEALRVAAERAERAERRAAAAEEREEKLVSGDCMGAVVAPAFSPLSAPRVQLCSVRGSEQPPCSSERASCRPWRRW